MKIIIKRSEVSPEIIINTENCTIQTIRDAIKTALEFDGWTKEYIDDIFNLENTENKVVWNKNERFALEQKNNK